MSRPCCGVPDRTLSAAMNRGSVFLVVMSLIRSVMAYRRTEKVVRRLAARHDAIMAAARGLVTERGWGAWQIAWVAWGAGFAAGPVYRFFPSRTEMVRALVNAMSEREIAAMRRAADAAPGPLSALAAAIASFAARALA